LSKNRYTFRAKLVPWSTQKATWHFVTLPVKISREIKALAPPSSRRGWRSVKVEAKIGKSKWQTSIFPDSKSGSHVLPVKAEVRRNEKVKAGDMAEVTLLLL